MEELQKKVKTILEELEKKLENKEDLEFAQTKVLELYETFANELEKVEESCINKIDIIATKHSLLETKLAEVEGAIDKIKEDIYISTKEEYDLDIVCPYCDAEFTIDATGELQNAVTCPECNNVIELDWNDDEGCGHDCSGCHHDCDNDDDEEDDDEDM